jgi:hypothetical protein
MLRGFWGELFSARRNVVLADRGDCGSETATNSYFPALFAVQSMALVTHQLRARLVNPAI